MKIIEWADSEKKFIREHYTKKGAEWCSENMERSENAIKRMACTLGHPAPPRVCVKKAKKAKATGTDYLIKEEKAMAGVRDINAVLWKLAGETQ